MSTLAEVHRVVAAHLPGYEVRSATRIGEGLDNLAYEVNGELIVRFSKEPGSGRLLKEARLLTAVAAVSPLPVPEPIFVAAREGCLAYAKLPGLPLLNVPGGRLTAAVVTAVGELLTVLHALPADPWKELVETEDDPLESWLHEAEHTYAAVAEQIPPAHRPLIERFLQAPPPREPDARVFSHSDLGIEHVLVDPVAGRVTGIIDWSDAAITDPAHDYGLLYRDLGPQALRLAFAARETEAAVFYARCSVLEDLAYGMRSGQAVYAAKSLAAMQWLFPAG